MLKKVAGSGSLRHKWGWQVYFFDQLIAQLTYLRNGFPFHEFSVVFLVDKTKGIAALMRLQDQSRRPNEPKSLDSGCYLKNLKTGEIIPEGAFFLFLLSFSPDCQEVAIRDLSEPAFEKRSVGDLKS
ncbi:MAG: hypothetical protein KDC71_09025 [Acidobacteria bacterium]|nr:hypothetical protein [Acidobacteriota bacterium]